MSGKKLIGSTVALALLAGMSSAGSAFAKDEDSDHGKKSEEHHSGVISLEKAAKIAKKSLRIKSAELEKEHGRLIWSFDIAPKKSKTIVEVNVDAKTGEIVSTEFESAREEATEEKGGKGKERMERAEGNERGEKGKKSEDEEGEKEGNHHHEKGEKQDKD